MKNNARLLAVSALFGALTFVGSLISIPVGPVPITAQTLVVLLAAFLLPPAVAGLSMVVHLALRFLTAGFSVIITPSFGFVVAFIIVAFGASAASRPHPTTWTKLIVIAVVASLALYAIGIPYMAYILNVQMAKGLDVFSILKMGMLLFLPGDAIKAGLAVLLAKRLQPIFDRTML